MGQLNELQIKAAQPRDKEHMLSDGEGLYLRVRPNGKVWIYRYKQAGQEAKLSFGSYPTVTLAMARRKARDEAEKRAGGIDPMDARREQVERDRVARLNTFELMARAWHTQAQKDRQWSAGYAEKVMRHLELHIFPWIDHRGNQAHRACALPASPQGTPRAAYIGGNCVCRPGKSVLPHREAGRSLRTRHGLANRL